MYWAEHSSLGLAHFLDFENTIHRFVFKMFKTFLLWVLQPKIYFDNFMILQIIYPMFF